MLLSLNIHSKLLHYCNTVCLRSVPCLLARNQNDFIYGIVLFYAIEVIRSIEIEYYEGLEISTSAPVDSPDDLKESCGNICSSRNVEIVHGSIICT